MADTNETLAAKTLRTAKSLQTRSPSWEEIMEIARSIELGADAPSFSSQADSDRMRADAALALRALAMSVQAKDGNSNDRWQDAITKLQTWKSAGG